MYARSLDPSVLVFSLSLYRHPIICILFRSRFTSYNKQTKPFEIHRWGDLTCVFSLPPWEGEYRRKLGRCARSWLWSNPVNMEITRSSEGSSDHTNNFFVFTKNHDFSRVLIDFPRLLIDWLIGVFIDTQTFSVPTSFYKTLLSGWGRSAYWKINWERDEEKKEMLYLLP